MFKLILIPYELNSFKITLLGEKLISTLSHCVIEKFPLDYREIASFFSAVYPNKTDVFTPEYFKWRYEKAFDERPFSVAVFDSSKKVAQATVFQQKMVIDAKLLPVAQLGDLAVHPDYRSPKMVRMIYQKLIQIINEKNFSWVYTTPNSRSEKLNTRYLILKNKTALNYVLGMVLPNFDPLENLVQEPVNEELSEVIQHNINTQLQGSVGSMINWSRDSVIDKCMDPFHKHHVHCHEKVTIISRTFRKFNIKVFVIKAIIINNSEFTEDQIIIRKILSRVAVYHRTPFFIYWGINSQLPDIKQIAPFTKSLSKSITIQHSAEWMIMEKLSRLELIDLDIT